MQESRETVERKVKDLIIKEFAMKESEVTLGASFIEDLKVDSMDLTELVMSLEDQFGIEVEDEDAQKMKTVGDVVNLILAKKSASS